ncbi:hypothetical protein M0R45_019108 [Rubus argutus]|uniref:PB1 domain-containing protein n=1 Tax=Rubus argutus TaxID=59490 RepID=A0AAW1X4Z1_RUBAR
MCNKGIACLSESENPVDQQQPHQAVYLMESPATTPHFGSNSTHGTSSPVLNEENPRVKFLCSFSGSILPRPQDGKLRYVGGETRIVSVPRDIKYEELMSKMRELYEGAAVLKYQQPDEDLDALVSVVNDDDVTNMMEEYDKLGSGDGFTRLRIFLFSYPDQDGGSSHYDGDERDHERRYVDALNNLNDGSDFRKQHTESPVISSVDDLHVAEQFFSPMSLEGGLHSQRNEIPMPQYNLHRLKIPHVGSGQQHHQPISQRYNEMEAPWSPAYYSPRHHGHLDPRPMAEFPSSPSSARYRMPFSDLPDKCSDRMPEEFARPPLHLSLDMNTSHNILTMLYGFQVELYLVRNQAFQVTFFMETMLSKETVSVNTAGYVSKEKPHLEQPNMVNGFHQVANLCADCPPNRETFMLNPDAKLHHGYATEQNNDSSSLYNENHNQWVPHHLNCRAEEARSQVSGTGKLNDHYIVDGPGMNLPLVHNNMVDVHQVSNNFVHQRAGPEMGNELFHDRPVAGPPHVHIPPAEDRGVRYGNLPYAYGGDNLYPVSHGHAPGHAAWRNVQSTMHAVPPYDASIRLHKLMKVLGFDGKTVPDYSYGQALNLNPNTLAHENHHHQFSPELIQPTPDMLSSATPVDAVTRVMMLDAESLTQEQKEVNDVEKVENSDIQVINQNNLGDKNCEVVPPESMYSNCPELAEGRGNSVKTSDNDQSTPEISKLSVNNLSFVPEMMASVKKAVIDGAEEVKAKVEQSTDPLKSNAIAKEAATNSLEPVNTPGDGEVDSDSENVNNSKIEPTKAEAELFPRDCRQ